MGNKFDGEMERIVPKRAATDGGDRTDDAAQLASLKREIEESEGAERAGVACKVEGAALSVSVKGQPVGEWRAEDGNLVLYRPGSSSAEGQATNASHAAVMTARLVAAAGQA